MVIALAKAIHDLGINYQHHLHVTAIDIDPRAIHMAYAQLSLLHVPAHLIVGNSLSGEIAEHWYTPAHILGGWNARLALRRHNEPVDMSVVPATGTMGRPSPARSEAPPSGEPGQSRPVMPQQLSLF
jgi:hypothetical protein